MFFEREHLRHDDLRESGSDRLDFLDFEARHCQQMAQGIRCQCRIA